MSRRAKVAHVETPVLGPYQDHLKFNGRAPRTLAELQYAKAEYTNRCRVTEITGMRKQLAMLDLFLEPILKAGVRLSYREISAIDQGKGLRIYAPISSCERDSKLLEVLLSLGFREIERRAYGLMGDLVRLKHGRWLLVEIEIGKPVDTAAPGGS